MNTKTFMTVIVSFDMNLDRTMFIDIFGHNLGTHLHSKYLSFGENLIDLWCFLDSGNRAILGKRIDELVAAHEGK